MKITYLKKILDAVIQAWPYLRVITSIFWLVIIMPTLSIIFHFIYWIIIFADDDEPVNHGVNYNMFTGDIDPNKRPDGRYINDSLDTKTFRH